MPTRTPGEIRASIEQNRHELGTSLEKLRMEVVRVTVSSHFRKVARSASLSMRCASA